MADPVKDRPVEGAPEGKAWTSVDTRRVLPPAEQAIVDRMGEAVEQLGSLHRRLPAVLYMVTEAMAGQPSTGRGDGQVWNWCAEHERSTRECDALELLCEGEPDVRSDPVGNAAVMADMAKRDRRDLLKLAQLIESTARRMSILDAGYPTDQITLDEIEDDDLVGTKYCRACFKDNNDLTLVTIRAKTGEPYYAGLCKWCGERAAVIGGDPPTWMVAKRHRGDRIMPADLERAKKVHAEIKARTSTSKSKSKKRRK